jgi:hypothetical protein
MLLAARPLLLGGLLTALSALAPPGARANCFDPSRDGDVVSYGELFDVRRFDLEAEAWLPDVPTGHVVRKTRTAGDTIFVLHDFGLVALDATGAERYALPDELGVWDFAVRDGHLFVPVEVPAQGPTMLRSYDAATGALESETGPVVGGPVIAAPGRVILTGFSRFDAVPYDAAGQLGELFEVYPGEVFEGHGFRLADDGDHVVTDPAILDAATLEGVEGYEGSLPTAWGDHLVTVKDAELRLYDAARSFVGTRTLGGVGRVTGIFPKGDELWIFRCGPVMVERVDRAEFVPPRPLPAPLRAAGFGPRQRSFAMGEEGVLYFLVWSEEPHVRRWLPAEDRFLDSIPLREPARHVTRAPGGGVFVTYESGRVGRVARDADVELPFAWVPRHFSDGIHAPIVAGPWIVFTDSLRWHALDADGVWRSAYYEPDRASGATWDAERSRLLWLGYPSGTLHSIDVDSEGGLARGLAMPGSLGSPLVASPTDRLLAGSEIADLATLAPIADLGFPFYERRVGLWAGPDTLATLHGPTYGPSTYREWTADGAPRGPAVTFAGEPVALLPFDETRILLARAVEGDATHTRYQLVALGGDLDSDGVANGDDDYPLDPARYSDRDGDGVDDDADAFPDDPSETGDGDGDGLGDAADHLPELGAERIALLSGEDWVGIAGLGRSSRDIEAQLHVFADGSYAFCTARETCLGGTWQTLRRDKGLGLTVAAPFLTGFGQSIQAGLARDLDRKVSFRFLAKRARGSVRTTAEGAVRFTLRAPHRGAVAGFGPFTGAYRIRAEGEWLELERP